MSTLTEIETAIDQLGNDEKRSLLRFLVESLPPLEPREFTVEQMRGWIERDERDYAELKAEWARQGKSPPAELQR